MKPYFRATDEASDYTVVGKLAEDILVAAEKSGISTDEEVPFQICIYLDSDEDGALANMPDYYSEKVPLKVTYDGDRIIFGTKGEPVSYADFEVFAEDFYNCPFYVDRSSATNLLKDYAEDDMNFAYVSLCHGKHPYVSFSFTTGEVGDRFDNYLGRSRREKWPEFFESVYSKAKRIH